MIISNKYKSRHGLADFETNVFKLTNKKDDTTIDCELIKVPTYTFKHSYIEKVCEGNGWYSKGSKITETITHDFYWIVVLDGECLGCINTNNKKSISKKYALEDLGGKKYVKDFVKSRKKEVKTDDKIHTL